MLEKVRKTIMDNHMINMNDHIVAGLSGGGDSCALLHVLKALQGEYALSFTAVHINHGIRGDEALRDENFVLDLCKNLGIECRIFRFDMAEYAKEHKITLEEAGREFRYRAFNAVLTEKGRGKIAVAHNLNDRAETVFMRFIRGTGLKGLEGIPKTRDNIIRPLIDCKRSEIEEYLHKNNISYVHDSTNAMDIYTRNFIRLNILPLIEENLNPSVIDTLRKSSDVFALENAYMEEEALKAFKNLVTIEKNTLRIEKEGFSKLHKALRLRIARLSINEMTNSLKDYEISHAEMISEAFQYATGKEFHIPGDLIVQNSYKDIILYRKDIKPFKDISLKDGDFIYLDEIDAYLSISYFRPENKENFIKTCTKVFDYDKIKDKLFLRTRRQGDRIYIKEVGGTKKLKDYFIDNKVEKFKRDHIPLLASEKDILWIFDGKNITDSRFLSTGSQREIYINLWRKSNE
ncbi:tRNA lysidine(34) synthetase TilS [Anaeropeptidivorans aminofermentans]|jgi:tRNA(Ile)-lysidine synthase|uniref:tRNA lysidine(34) synthetase TilS n=1 Tax=Anaeropeptidivorans aminofermentans TaxID=2934315 RepID=UPI0020254593|nr:tRNA lysidine(34) synthetase TilS [Anaeropeptidivorans aminofermentans]